MQTAENCSLKQILDTSTAFDLGRFGYPEEDVWALPPATMRLTGRMVEVLRPKKILEFGSGFSTLVLATLIRDYGGTLLSFDHSARFTRAPELLLEKCLGKVARVATRPITFQYYGAKILPVYSIRWKDFDDFEGIELALIDGPPGDVGREAVLYELFPRLAVGAWIIVDDANRDYERHWLEAWKRVFDDGLEVHIFPDVGRGVGLLRKRMQKLPKYRFRWGELRESWGHAASLMSQMCHYE